MVTPIQIKNFITAKECEDIIEVSKNFELQSATTSYKQMIQDSNNEIRNDFNKREIAYINPDVFIGLEEKILNTINKLNILNNIIYTKIPYFSFNRYSVGDFLNYHEDSHEIEKGATITIVLELSEEFDGGEFCYIHESIEKTFDKGKGNLYIFDSFTQHKVKKILKGNRYSINCWPKFSKKKTLF